MCPPIAHVVFFLYLCTRFRAEETIASADRRIINIQCNIRYKRPIKEQQTYQRQKALGVQEAIKRLWKK